MTRRIAGQGRRAPILAGFSETGQWPTRMKRIAQRNWDDLIIKNRSIFLTTTFLHETLEPVQADAISTFLLLFPEADIKAWFVETCEKLLDDEIDADWLIQQPINVEIGQKYNLKITAILTLQPLFIASDPSTVMNLGIIIAPK